MPQLLLAIPIAALVVQAVIITRGSSVRLAAEATLPLAGAIGSLTGMVWYAGPETELGLPLRILAIVIFGLVGYAAVRPVKAIGNVGALAAANGLILIAASATTNLTLQLARPTLIPY